MHIDPAHLVTDAAALQGLYGAPGEASLKKEVDHVHPHYRAFIEAAPFAMLATSGPDGLDASPRGDPAGFVVVEDEKTLLLPDRRGNNRMDSLLNVLVDPRVALLFLVPGVGETLRVNGTARVSVDPALLARFAMDGKLPRSVLIVDVQTVYFQCSRALLRSRLWDPTTQVPRSALPSTGRILSDLTAGTFDGAAYDRDLPARVAGTLY
ncbi:pyridoxamine 5'-phosphate oxidase family protein [Achromobacter sp. ESBL13]|uniref:pyridoxamine 5'-phosphate oxidase family protein n=1 Tax=Achromobacter sp. ESBL13 TaxID=3077328 RepID=UPI002FC73D7F